MNKDSKFARVFEFSRGSIMLTYDPDAANDECVYLDPSGPMFMTLDETHRFHAFFMGFLAEAREMPRRPTHAQVQQLSEASIEEALVKIKKHIDEQEAAS